MPDEDVYRVPEANLSIRPHDLSGPLETEGGLPPKARIQMLAVFYVLITIWFAYDGWFAPASEHVMFNRVGAGVLAMISTALVLAARSVGKAVESRTTNAVARVYLSPDGRALRVATIPWLWSLVFGGLNLIPHGRVGVGLLWFLGSQFSVGIAGLVLALLVNGILDRTYIERGYRLL